MKGVDFKFNHDFVFGGYGNTISTVPLPELLDNCGPNTYPVIFKTVKGFNLIANAKDTDAYFTTYIVDRDYAMSRFSVTGNTVIAEFPNGSIDEDEDEEISELDSISGYYNITIRDPRIQSQSNFKIIPIDERERQKIILELTDKYNIYTLGRNATWRLKTMLDDLVGDVRIIRNMITGDHSKRYEDKLMGVKDES